MLLTSKAASQREFCNWAGNQTCRPAGIHMPSSEAEFVELVRLVRARGQTLRVVGAGHSWSGIACTDGHLVSLDRMAEVLELDADAGTVTVEAGVRLHALVDYLLERGMALPNLGSVAEQSVAGVISTGTHGTGVGIGNLSSMVESLRLVTGTGDIVEVDRESDPALFAAARVGLGSLGIITAVTMRCVPAFNLYERSWTLRFDEALCQMQSLVDRHDHIKFWWLPHTGRIQVFAADRTPREPTRVKLMHRIDDSGLLKPVFAGVLGLGGRYPEMIPALNWLVAATYFADYELVDRSHRVFNLPMPPSHLEAEFGFAREDAESALEQMRALIEWDQIRVNFITEVRFVAADDIWLSPAYGRESCQLGAYIGETPQWRSYFEGVEQIAWRMGARPHWGKTFFAGAEQMREVFPHFDDFLEVRERIDPDRVFSNAFTRRVLGS
ncbi:FAD-binding protein [Persicimonas caeni]|uniref:FAD-binding protein n=1 Tax=Persicimonas caeni TaxID=2292766 RepID=A0A4Y6PZD1_PERCE|nr:D-arabinono-1,4-lactone oxidase [Persicimonas caeni]QDG53529.1 FAD-binding protein [Persicimonas caeni]QED34750.1 FAD-binding protein [Persicimonas caeni]